MKKLRKIDKKSLNTVDNISNTCACSAYKCSHGCSDDGSVYDAYNEYYNASRLYASRGVEPWGNPS